MQSSKVIYQGKYLQKVEEIQIGDSLYEKAYIRGAVIVFAQDSDGQWIFIEEKRPHEEITQRIKPVTGFIDDGMDWKETAQKELQEEIGYGAKSLDLIHHVRHSSTVTVSKYFVLARDLYPSKLDSGDDEDQILKTIHMPIETYIEKTLTDEYPCNFDSLGVFLLKEKFLNCPT